MMWANWTMDMLPGDAGEVLTTFGFGSYDIDFSDVALDDAIALVEFCRQRNTQRRTAELMGPERAITYARVG